MDAGHPSESGGRSSAARPAVRRRLVRLAVLAGVCYMIGAAGAVAFAWASVQFGPIPDAGISEANQTIVSRDGDLTFGFRASTWSAENTLYIGLGHLADPPGPIDRRGTLPYWAVTPEDGQHAHTWAFGWPFRCLRSSSTYRFAGGSTGYLDLRCRGFWMLSGLEKYEDAGNRLIVHPQELPGVQWLPTGVIWPGLLANAAIYALPLFLLLVLVPAARGAIRRKRNRCALCGYDRRATPGDAPCPECGARYV